MKGTHIKIAIQLGLTIGDIIAYLLFDVSINEIIITHSMLTIAIMLGIIFNDVFKDV